LLIKLILLFGTFFLMEGVAWFTHKYVMHGWMWRWHASHHHHHHGIWEKNDLFGICFAVLATVTIVAGNEVENLWFLYWIGLGVSLYGFFYTVFHDVLVHRRIKIKFTPRNPYLKRIIRAHYLHHAVHTRDGAEAFGFLYAPKKFDTSVKPATKTGA
jgi:beta-carotene 3-hydroxylase